MEIFKEAQKNFDYMVRIRRHMHEYPEMTGQEFETLEFIKKELDALGIEYVEVPDGGIVGQIHGGKPGKTVMLIGHIDTVDVANGWKIQRIYAVISCACQKMTAFPTPAAMIPIQPCCWARLRS